MHRQDMMTECGSDCRLLIRGLARYNVCYLLTINTSNLDIVLSVILVISFLRYIKHCFIQLFVYIVFGLKKKNLRRCDGVNKQQRMRKTMHCMVTRISSTAGLVSLITLSLYEPSFAICIICANRKRNRQVSLNRMCVRVCVSRTDKCLLHQTLHICISVRLDNILNQSVSGTVFT